MAKQNGSIPAITIEIFDPPMCCPTGLCGPTIDPALLDINEAVLRLRKERGGEARVERYLLSQQGPKFMQNPAVFALLKEHGVQVLPVTTVNGQVVKKGAYPSYDELVQLINVGLAG